MRQEDAGGFDLGSAMIALLQPDAAGGWLKLFVLVVLGVILGLFTAAVFAARHGAGQRFER